MKQRRGNMWIVLLGAGWLMCLMVSVLAVWAYVELPQRGWNKVEACVGQAVARTGRVGVWWTSPIYSPAPAIAHASQYAVCGTVPWPPWMITQGNRTFNAPWLNQR